VVTLGGSSSQQSQAWFTAAAAAATRSLGIQATGGTGEVASARAASACKPFLAVSSSSGFPRVRLEKAPSATNSEWRSWLSSASFFSRAEAEHQFRLDS